VRKGGVEWKSKSEEWDGGKEVSLNGDSFKF